MKIYQFEMKFYQFEKKYFLRIQQGHSCHPKVNIRSFYKSEKLITRSITFYCFFYLSYYQYLLNVFYLIKCLSLSFTFNKV